MQHGIHSLTEAIRQDLSKEKIEFDLDGCKTGLTKDRYHLKLKWILDRAEQYAKFMSSTVEQVLEAWEVRRNYWYMNFYQDCAFPDLNGKGVIVTKQTDWLIELGARFGKEPANWAFVCPSCNKIQTGQDFINAGVEDWHSIVYFNCISRYDKKRSDCKWTLGGLLQIHKQVIVSRDLYVTPVFDMAPISVSEPALAHQE